MSPSSGLIVPIRDRRRGKRILTLKNVRNVTFVAVAAFIVLMVYSEVRGPKQRDDYGRLFGQQVKAPAPEVQRAPMIVTEGQIPDQDHADPMLLNAAAREQSLGVEPNSLTPAPVAPVQSAAVSAPIDTKNATIVGDANGVTIVKSETQDRGVLGGGIFKEH